MGEKPSEETRMALLEQRMTTVEQGMERVFEKLSDIQTAIQAMKLSQAKLGAFITIATLIGGGIGSIVTKLVF